MEWTVAIGVDTHAHSHVAVALDRLGRVLGQLEIAVDERGFTQLRRFACSFGEPAFVLEGTGCYGASLARALLADGFAVYECERPERRSRNDKNDLIDAEQAARRLLTGKRLPPDPKKWDDVVQAGVVIAPEPTWVENAFEWARP